MINNLSKHKKVAPSAARKNLYSDADYADEIHAELKLNHLVINLSNQNGSWDWWLTLMINTLSKLKNVTLRPLGKINISILIMRAKSALKII